MKIKLFIAILIINFLNIGHVKAVFDIEAKTAILQDYLSGEILYEKDPDLSIYPASMTKIMIETISKHFLN